MNMSSHKHQAQPSGLSNIALSSDHFHPPSDSLYSTMSFSFVKRKITLWSARLESYLSSHAFEILFLAMFILANILQFVWGAHDEFHHVRKTIEKENPGHEAFKWYIAIARGAGYTLNLNSALIIILAARLFVTSIRETPLHKVLPLDKSFPQAHIIVGYAIVIGVAIHVPFHFAWLITFDAWDSFKLWSFSMSVAVGVPLMLIFIGMFITALPWFRKNHFRLFYVAHLIGAALFFPLLILHGMYRKKPETYKWITAPLIIYFIDRIVRRLKISTANLELSGGDSTIKAGNVLELRVPKPFGYRAGQYAEIQVPILGKEWHPFTIASAPHEDTMCFYIKSLGDWTQKLYAEFETRREDESIPPLSVRVRGPYGAPAQHTTAYRRVVLISGGIGATPFAAISKHLHHRSISDDFHMHKTTYEQELSKKNGGVENIISKTIENLYAIGGASVAPKSEAVKEAAGKHVANTLKLSSKNIGAHDESCDGCTHSESALPVVVTRPTKAAGFSDDSSFYSLDSDGDSFSTGSFEKIIDFGIGGVAKAQFAINRQPFKQVGGMRAKILSFLHTTRVVLFLLLTLLVRFALVCIVSIFKIGKFDFTDSTITPAAFWAVGVDVVLGTILNLVMTTTILLEISFMKYKFFSRAARCIDFFAFLPLSALSSFLTVKSWASRDVKGALTSLHFGFFLPLLFILLAFRLYRSIGSRDLLAGKETTCGCRKSVPEVDFVWTTPRSGEDEWLRDELEPLAQGSSLRLHRYVTREKAADLETGEKHIDVNAGRPQWDALFAEIAARSPSGGDVGVFFCGPHVMGADVQKSIRSVEVQSNLRGAYLGTLSDGQIMRDLGLRDRDEVRRLRKYGSNVRFVFREENF